MMELVRVCRSWDSSILGVGAIGDDPIWYMIKELQASDEKDSKLALCSGRPIFCEGEAHVPRSDLIMLQDTKALMELENKLCAVVN
jgi:hypothetical protein